LYQLVVCNSNIKSFVSLGCVQVAAEVAEFASQMTHKV
jgi:hypothetical protein